LALVVQVAQPLLTALLVAIQFLVLWLLVTAHQVLATLVLEVLEQEALDLWAVLAVVAQAAAAALVVQVSGEISAGRVVAAIQDMQVVVVAPQALAAQESQAVAVVVPQAAVLALLELLVVQVEPVFLSVAAEQQVDMETTLQ
jgi:hypothetical protein